MAEGFSTTALAGFELFFRPWLFSRIRVVPGVIPPLPDGLPTIFVSNHTSWWDPFVIREMHRGLRTSDPLYTVMLEPELERRPFFRRIGVVGVDPSSVGSVRGVLRTLRQRVQRHPNAFLTYFPQGRIWPATRRPLGFHRGIELFIQALAPVAVLPLGIRVEPLSATRPAVFALPGEITVYHDGKDLAPKLEAETAALLDRISIHLEHFGEQSVQAWPPPPAS